MQIGPKYKICRRLGTSVFEKCQTQKYALSESRRRGRRGRRSRSKYNDQLLEKQKVRYTYGMNEGQFSRYVRESLETGEQNPIEELFQRLEGRLDNIIYQMRLATTRPMARQLVVHGHFSVNGKRVSAPSFQVSEGDVISVRERSRSKEPFTNLEEQNEDYMPPEWLSVDYGAKEGTVKALPTFKTEERAYDLTSVIEFYNR